MEVGEEGDYILYNILSLHCHHQIDSCIKTDICESRFNASLIVRDKATRQCPRTTTFLKRKRAEADSNRGPSAYQPNVLSLCQTGSHSPQERTWIDIIANWGLRGLADCTALSRKISNPWYVSGHIVRWGHWGSPRAITYWKWNMYLISPKVVLRHVFKLTDVTLCYSQSHGINRFLSPTGVFLDCSPE